MKDPYEAMQRLKDEADLLPEGPAKVALLQEAVRRADVLQDVEWGFYLRKALMDAAHKDHPDTMLVAFAWCLAAADRDPRRFENEDLLVEYTWIIGFAAGFPDITRPRLEGLLADLERRFTAAGAGKHIVHSQRRDLMMALGEHAAARAAHAAMQKCRRDSFSNSKSFLALMDLVYHTFQGQWQEAVRAARPVLQERLSFHDTEFPTTLSEVLYPLLRLGRIAEAREYHRRGYRLVSRESHFVKQQANHLRFAVLAGDLAQAKRLVEKHLADALQYVLLDERFAFLLAARLWTDRLLDRDMERIKVRLPPELPAADTQGKTDVRQLGDWFTEQAKAIARRFDARNGNDYYQQQIDELSELLRLAVG